MSENVELLEEQKPQDDGSLLTVIYINIRQNRP